MTLGSSLFQARKKQGLSQEDVAEKLGVSRQTVSKWETDETVPDLRQAKKMAALYHLSLDELIQSDLDKEEIEQAIERSTDSLTDKIDSLTDKIDWTSVWAKKYPILAEYPNQVNISWYAHEIERLLDALKIDYGFGEQDAMLVLKDILYQVWKAHKQSRRRP